MRIWVLVAMVLVGTSLVVGPARADKDNWGWFYAGSLVNKWSIIQGQAEVELSSGSLVARLYENGELAITLKGTIKNGRVRATALFHDTDALPAKLAGKYGRVRWQEGGARDAILLTESEVPWGVTIGLTHEVR